MLHHDTTRPALIFLGLAFVLLLGSFGFAQSERIVLSSEELKWTSDANAAQTTAQTMGRPMMLYLYTTSSHGCRDMEQITFRDPNVVAAMKEFELAAVDTTRNPGMLRTLKIIKVPAVIFYNSKGVEVFRAVGYKPVNEFMDYVRAVPRSTRNEAGGTDTSGMETPTVDPSKLVLTPRPGTRRQTIAAYAPQALSVFLPGDFCDWRQDAIPMTRDKSGFWWVDLHLFEGVYEYKFMIDDRWLEDPNAKFKRPDPYGGYNSVLVIGEVPKGPEIRGNRVTFIYYNREAQKVEFAGSFNGWMRIPMFAKGDGNWGVAYEVPRGAYEYKFVVDETWMPDPRNLNWVIRDGNVNSIVRVGMGDPPQ